MDKYFSVKLLLAVSMSVCVHEYVFFCNIKAQTSQSYLVAQWLKKKKKEIHLPMQETQVRSLPQEDLTCPGAIKPVHQNY